MKLWIARDKFKTCNNLHIFMEKPEPKNNGIYWQCYSHDTGYEIPKDWFPEITFENSPQEINLLTNDEIIDIRNEGYDI